MPVYIDQYGKELRLGEQIGQGGEATVYASLSDPSLVIKIYHDAADSLKSEKLQAMVNISHPEILRFAAWPQSLVRTSQWGTITGVVMPKVMGTVIHNLYNPSSRKAEFPSADWRFLVRTASNFATAVDTLHQRGIVIGDVNQGNVLVSNEAIVRFIDCDSFQIRDGSRVFRCQVGVPHFTPPELQTRRFSEFDRTTNHDRFGLAVMIFHLLFAGRHPFAGRFTGKTDPSLEDKIKDFRFAFSNHRNVSQMEPPPFTPLLSDVPQDVAELFESAFCKSSSTSTRPSAATWRNSLIEFERRLVQCPRDPGHFHLSGARCPWCRISGEGGPNFFESVSWSRIHSQLSSIELSKIISAIAGYPSNLEGILKYDRNKLVFDHVKSEILNDHASNETMVFLKIMIAICFAGAGLLFLLGIPTGAAVFGLAAIAMSISLAYLTRHVRLSRLSKETQIVELKEKTEKLRSEFLKQVKIAEVAIGREKDRVIKTCEKIADVDKLMKSSVSNISQDSEQQQLEEHLSRHLICHAKIPGIGPARVATLESYGIDSALDIDRVRLARIPRLGNKQINALYFWREQVVREFRFDRTRNISAKQLQKIEYQFNQEKLRLMKDVTEGQQLIQNISERHRIAIQAFIRNNELE